MWRSASACSETGGLHRCPRGCDGRVDFFGPGLGGGVGHPDRPDVEAALIDRRDLPDAPDAPALVVALVGDVVPTDVALGPVAGAVGEVVAPGERERADPISP